MTVRKWCAGQLAFTSALFGFLTLAITATSPALAQNFSPMWGNLGGNLAINRLVMQGVTAQASSVEHGEGGESRPVQGPNTNFERFVSAPARTRANLAKFVEKTRATDPVGAEKMAALFASTDVIGMIDSEMQQKFGMRADNVADAYAVWWVSAWMGAKGRTDDATPGQMAMVKRQATNALAATPEFTTATDAGKQEIAEAMLVQTMMIQASVDTYKSDLAMLAKTRAAIAKGAKGMGLDLSTMTLTDQGFVPAKTGAADPAPGTPEHALAASDSTAAAPPYVLIAAAGGAGIGGVLLLGKMMGRRG